MNTDGLPLSSSIRGKPDLLTPKAGSNKKESEQNGKGLDTFSQVLQTKSTKAPVAPKERIEARKSEQAPGPRRTDDKDETPSVKERTIEKLDKPKAKKANSEREQAMLDFMDSMESELGIPPQRIVEAMAQLPEQKMSQTPEETASQVIEDLDLPPEQAEQAYAKYMSFLAQMQQFPQASVATPAPAAAAGQSGLAANGEKVLSAKEKREILNNSLDRLSQKFFMQGPRSFDTAQKISEPMSMRAPGDGLMDRLNAAQRGDDFSSQALTPGLTSEGLRNGLDPSQGNLPLQPGPNPPQNYQNTDAAVNAMKASSKEGDSSAIPPELMAKLSALGASAASLQQSVQKAPNGQAMTESQQGNPQGGGASAFQLGPSLTAMGLAGGQGQASGDSADFGSSKDSDDQGSLKSEGLGTKGQMGSIAGEKTMGFRDTLQSATAANSMTSTNRHETVQNMQKVMDQAQMIVRKGGGEATIRMNPEGLGEVHMKVVVKDGRVNLEMATESKEAKKAIEESLNDLKTGLGQHKLSVESVKVDVGLKNSNDGLSQQHQQQQKNLDLMNQNRDQARQFFQQFREENMGKRDSFFEMPGVKAYRQPTQGGPAPLSEASDQRARAQGRGERMNLVA